MGSAGTADSVDTLGLAEGKEAYALIKAPWVIVTTNDSLKTTHYAPPAKRSKGVMVKDVGELVSALTAKGLL